MRVRRFRPCCAHPDGWLTGVLAAMIAFLLAGCGGGGGGGSGGGGAGNGGGASSGGDSGSLGIYVGARLIRCDSLELLALVTEEGGVTFFSGIGARLDYGVGITAAGSLIGSRPTYSASVTEYGLPGPSLLTKVALDFLPYEIGEIWNGEFNVRWSSQTQGSDPLSQLCNPDKTTLTRHADLYERPASLAKLAGVYSSSYNAQSFYAVTLSLDAGGQLSGSDSQGCLLNGSATAPHADHNYYAMTVTVDSCPSSGKYSGVALLADGAYGGKDNLLLLNLVDDTSVLAVALALSR